MRTKLKPNEYVVERLANEVVLIGAEGELKRLPNNLVVVVHGDEESDLPLLLRITEMEDSDIVAYLVGGQTLRLQWYAR